MKKITFIFVVLCMGFANAQSFSPVWEGSYLPEQEAGCYVSFIDIENETIGITRSCEGEREIVFGDISEESWVECNIPDSLGEVLRGFFVGETLYLTTSSGWFCSISESCSLSFLAEFSGYVGMEKFSDTLFFYGGSVEILGDTFSEIFSFEHISGSWSQILKTEKESVLGLSFFDGKLFSVVLDEGEHMIMKLDSSWQFIYVFPENEYFISWENGGDRLYVSSTNFLPPTQYGIISEWKDGDMDSLFASDGNILAIEATECFVFCVGHFTNLGNCDAENLAMFDRATKEIIQTDRGLDGNGYAVSSSDDFVYVGGAFMYGADIYSPGIISLPACAEDLSVAENMEEIKIFPNPAESLIRIQNGAGKEVRVFSLSREIFLLQNEVEKDKILYLENISSGTYYIVIGGKIFSFVKI